MRAQALGALSGGYDPLNEERGKTWIEVRSLPLCKPHCSLTALLARAMCQADYGKPLIKGKQDYRCLVLYSCAVRSTCGGSGQDAETEYCAQGSPDVGCLASSRKSSAAVTD